MKQQENFTKEIAPQNLDRQGYREEFCEKKSGRIQLNDFYIPSFSLTNSNNRSIIDIASGELIINSEIAKM